MFGILARAATVIVILLTGGSCLAFQRESSILGRVSDRTLVTLGGNTRTEAVAANDGGEVDGSFAMNHMMLQLKRSPVNEKAAAQFVAELTDPQSPNFHKWVSADEFGRKFGSSASDIETVTSWLEANGFRLNTVYPNGLLLDFSGTAAQVKAAFHTSIHSLNVNGVTHFANWSDPQIPAALAPVVEGVLSLHDFRPHKLARPKAVSKKNTDPQYTFVDGQTFQALVPADLATIYDFKPLFAAGITGNGQTIAVIEDTDLYSSADWNTFRTAFGLSQYSTGTLTTVHPAPLKGSNNCSDPGVNSDDSEAILDAEWATAAAPGAAIQVAACSDQGVATPGIVIAAQNIVNGAAPPAVMSISYGQCEAENGATLNAAFNSLYQQAAAQGISVFVAAGDEGAAACDAGLTTATHGIGVSAFASTPYNVAVGGTDFSDTLNGTVNQYWGATNSSTYGSALSYIPEIPWNDSCASGLLASYMGYSVAYGTAGFCSSTAAQQGGFVAVAGASGGPSNCATGAPSINGVVSGTCQGFAKPSWQSGAAGNPADGVRDIPDVSMFASDGAAWGHFVVVCYSDRSNGGARCSGAPYNWSGFGGTSVASPIMAGVQALINQNSNGKQGNPNPVYYSLAATTPGIFHTTTQGDIDMNCSGPRSCFGFVGNPDYGRDGRIFGTTYGGVMSTAETALTPAYSASPTASQIWNFATGLGSVDVYKLVMNWGNAH